MQTKILNALGKPIVLNDFEARVAQMAAKMCNDLGFEVDTTSLTGISKKISVQKFFEVAPADYLPIRVGENAWSSNLLTYRSFAIADDFEKGIVNTGGNNGQLASADSGVDSLSIKVYNWAKNIGYTIMDLAQASKAGNWDLVTAKEQSRKKNWDLGIQKIAFLGAANDTSCLGLLNQAGITENTALIPQSLSSMAPIDLKQFLISVLQAYRSNAKQTAWPTHFIIPEADYVGLLAPSSADFPLKSILELLLESFKVVTGNPGFKILPLAYANKANNSQGKNIYVLLNYDEESLRMDLPVDYTVTLANSINNFSLQNVGYGQFTGVLAYRPREMLYLTNTTDY